MFAGNSGVPVVTTNQAMPLFCEFARIIQLSCYRQKSGHAHLLFYLHTWLLGFVCLFAATAAACILNTNTSRTQTHTHTYTTTCIATFDISKHFMAACSELANFPQFDAGRRECGLEFFPQKRSDRHCTMSLSL